MSLHMSNGERTRTRSARTSALFFIPVGENHPVNSQCREIIFFLGANSTKASDTFQVLAGVTSR